MLVSALTQVAGSRAQDAQVAGGSGLFTIQGRPTSARSEVTVDGMLLIRNSLKSRGLSEHSVSMIMSSWRESTKKQYMQSPPVPGLTCPPLCLLGLYYTSNPPLSNVIASLLRSALKNDVVRMRIPSRVSPGTGGDCIEFRSNCKLR